MQHTFLVTGGTGFIGTWVLREILEQGHRAVALDQQAAPERWQAILGSRAAEVPLARTHLGDPVALGRLLEDRGITQIVHLAALLTPACQADPWLGLQVNVVGTMALFEAARRLSHWSGTIAYASSVAVFGEASASAEHASSAPARVPPPTFYGAFKQATEDFAHQYWQHFGLRSVGLRPQVVYGPERLVGLTAGPSLAARAVARGERYQIPYTGRVGYDWVGDVARAFVRAALEAPAGAQVLDLEGPPASVEEIVATLETIAPSTRGQIGIAGPLIPAHAPPEPRRFSEHFPGWTTTPLETGLRATIDWYRARASSGGVPG